MLTNPSSWSPLVFICVCHKVLQGQIAIEVLTKNRCACDYLHCIISVHLHPLLGPWTFCRYLLQVVEHRGVIPLTRTGDRLASPFLATPVELRLVRLALLGTTKTISKYQTKTNVLGRKRPGTLVCLIVPSPREHQTRQVVLRRQKARPTHTQPLSDY